MPSDERNSGDPWVAPSVEALQASLPQFEILDVIGEGGMGAVFRARQPKLDRLVAIKILPEALTRSEHSSLKLDERFRREAKALAKLDHPAITTVYDYGQTESGMHYLVIEYIDGMDLHQYLHHCGGTLPLPEVLYVGLRVLEALAYAHGQGILHRDIKPSNILVRRKDGAVKLVDFGLVKIMSGSSDSASRVDLTLTNVAVGTPDFVPPEALLPNAQPDPRGDIYSLGVTLYLLLTGRVPRGKFKSVSGMVGHLDPRIDSVVERAVEMEPEDRYQTAEAFREALLLIASPEQAPRTAFGLTAASGGMNTESSQAEKPKEVVLVHGSGASAEPTNRASASATHPALGLAARAPTENRSRAVKGGLLLSVILLTALVLFGIARPGSDDTAEANLSGETLSPSRNPSAGPVASAKDVHPASGVVRVWGHWDRQVIDASQFKTTFGDSTAYTSLLVGAGNHLIGIKADGEATLVNLESPLRQTTARQLNWFDRQNHAWVADGYLRHDKITLDTHVLQKRRKILNAGIYGYFYLDQDASIQLHGWETAPGGREPMEQIISSIQDESIASLAYSFSRYEGDQRLTILTSHNRLRTWHISKAFEVREFDPLTPPEPIAEVISAGFGFGGWLARAESGNVYCEGKGRFDAPVAQLSPAIQLRHDNGIVAAQRPDGSWRALGRDKTIVEAIGAIGKAIDLDFEHRGYWGSVVAWLEPPPARSPTEIAAALPTPSVPEEPES